MMYVTYTTKDYRRSGRMCRPYKYLISKGGTPYIAFVHTHAFKRWLRERGLKLRKAGKRFAAIEGEYFTQYADLTERLSDWRKETAQRTMRLSNGAYVPCLIERDEQGCVIELVHHTGIADTDFHPLAVQARLAEHQHYYKLFG